MKKLEFSIDIHAPKERVWSILWEDKTFRDWANNIDEGMYLVGDLQEGGEVRFTAKDGKMGVTSLVERLVPNEFVSFRHKADVVEGSGEERDNEWSDGRESYLLVEHGEHTALTLALDTPPEQEENMERCMPKALQRVKELAEAVRA